MDDAEKLEKTVPQTDLGMKYVLSIIEHIEDFDEIERIGAHLLGYVEFIRSYKGDEPILKPCPCCGGDSVNFMEIQRLFSWELTLFCPHRGCDFEATGRGMTRHGAERRAVKRWNELAE